MGNVNDWVGTIGGTILGIELVVLLIVLIALNAALAYGLLWVLRKMPWVHTKRVFVQGLVAKYVDRGTRAAAMPVIVSTSVWRGLKAGLRRATHWQPVGHSQPTAALPAPTQPEPGSGTTRAA